MNTKPTFFAHSGKAADKSDWQPLDQHLLNVARLASEFAEPFGASEWAYAAGIAHDQGKATDAFMRRLEGRGPLVDHSTAGGRLVEELYSMPGGTLLAPLVLGHHAGLANHIDSQLEDRPSQRLKSVFERLERSAPVTELPYCHLLPDVSPVVLKRLVEATKRVGGGEEMAVFNMFTLAHLLFGSLVDADWSDTERVMDPDSYELRTMARAIQLPLEELNRRLDNHLARVSAGCDDTPVNRARADMLVQAQSKASLPPGIFELEMPTGAGKTLTSLSFALRHALTNEKRRVIYAIPFMSIVDQTADIFRDIIGRESVLEHVSSYDYGYDITAAEDASQNVSARRERMLAQNWEAPLIVTTNVQLFESLFSNRVSRSRKVHNIAGSVIVLDEVQSLPSALLKPTLAMIESLVSLAGVSVVLCTATQPALDKVWPFNAQLTRIIEDPSAYHDVFDSRVTFDLDHIGDEGCSLDWLASSLADESQALCIVSSRKAARLVYDALLARVASNEEVYHLSALMVPAHRAHVIGVIRQRLSAGLPVRVVSTQLIEAGVDVDFPVVYRETTGIDSILQAAGRCNREGRMGAPGRVVVFDCTDFERPACENQLSQMRRYGIASIDAARRHGYEPFGAQSVRRYFEGMHSLSMLDGRNVFELVVGSSREERKDHLRGRFAYEDIANRYQFITDKTDDLFVPWEYDGKALLATIEAGGLTPGLFPRIQRYTISIPHYLYGRYEAAGAIRHIDGFPIAVLETSEAAEQLYDSERGLLRVGEGDIDVLVV